MWLLRKFTPYTTHYYLLTTKELFVHNWDPFLPLIMKFIFLSHTEKCMSGCEFVLIAILNELCVFVQS